MNMCLPSPIVQGVFIFYTAYLGVVFTAALLFIAHEYKKKLGRAEDHDTSDPCREDRD